VRKSNSDIGYVGPPLLGICLQVAGSVKRGFEFQSGRRLFCLLQLIGICGTMALPWKLKASAGYRCQKPFSFNASTLAATGDWF